MGNYSIIIISHDENYDESAGDRISEIVKRIIRYGERFTGTDIITRTYHCDDEDFKKIRKMVRK